jgi:hypothetical protein
MQDALGVLHGMALYDGAQHDVAVRVAEHEVGTIYLDLCDDQWRAVKITARGWEVTTNCPMKFIRRKGMLSLPEPLPRGSLDELRSLVNITDDDTWTLVCGFLVGAMHPHGPYAALAVNGEQGAAKSTLSRMLRNLIDPHQTELRSLPRDVRDLMIAASGSWLTAFDNVSFVAPWLSDALCRLCSGAGFATRQLHTDDEEMLFSAARPVLFNGIEEVATRPDLLQRSMLVNLRKIDTYKGEAELWQQYHQARPRVLGALLTVVAGAIRELPNVSVIQLPRMADFARWVTAAESALGWTTGRFMKAYEKNQQAGNAVGLENSCLGPAVLKLAHEHPSWSGTAGDLLKALERYLDQGPGGYPQKPADWPRTAHKVSGDLRRLVPSLRSEGVQVEFDREASRRLIYVKPLDRAH